MSIEPGQSNKTMNRNKLELPKKMNNLLATEFGSSDVQSLATVANLRDVT